MKYGLYELHGGSGGFRSAACMSSMAGAVVLEFAKYVLFDFHGRSGAFVFTRITTHMNPMGWVVSGFARSVAYMLCMVVVVVFGITRSTTYMRSMVVVVLSELSHRRILHRTCYNSIFYMFELL